MRVFRRNILFLLVLFISALFVACQPDTVCRTNMQVSAGISPYWYQINADRIRQLSSTWDSVQVQGIGSDSVMQWNTAACAFLPMRADSSITAYRIVWHEMTDSLILFTTNDLRFVSMACGCIVYHTIDSVGYTTHFIDSLVVVDASVSNEAQENIVLYLHDFTEE